MNENKHPKNSHEASPHGRALGNAIARKILARSAETRPVEALDEMTRLTAMVTGSEEAASTIAWRALELSQDPKLIKLTGCNLVPYWAQNLDRERQMSAQKLGTDEGYNLLSRKFTEALPLLTSEEQEAKLRLDRLSGTVLADMSEHPDDRSSEWPAQFVEDFQSTWKEVHGAKKRQLGVAADEVRGDPELMGLFNRPGEPYGDNILDVAVSKYSDAAPMWESAEWLIGLAAAQNSSQQSAS